MFIHFKGDQSPGKRLFYHVGIRNAYKANGLLFIEDMLNLTNPPQAANKALDAYLDGIKHLPPTPTLMIQLIELFRQPDADVDENCDDS